MNPKGMELLLRLVRLKLCDIPKKIMLIDELRFYMLSCLQ